MELDKVVNSLEKMLEESKYNDSVQYNPWADTETLEAAIALLKAQEPIEARLNLCKSCAKEYAECEADKTDLVYGRGVGNDNIIGCPWYANRWKAQKPRVMTLEEVLAWAEMPAEKRDPIFFEQRKGPNGWIANSACPKDYYLYCEDGDARCWTSRPTDEQREAVKWE